MNLGCPMKSHEKKDVIFPICTFTGGVVELEDPNSPCFIGPHKEKTELLLFPISKTTGLHQVHPTWAGTFVLAALVAVFPGLSFVLLDSDCLPVTLFEVEDLWTEAFLARFPAHSDVGIPMEHPLYACQRFQSDPKVQYTQHRVSSANGTGGTGGH